MVDVLSLIFLKMLLTLICFCESLLGCGFVIIGIGVAAIKVYYWFIMNFKKMNN